MISALLFPVLLASVTCSNTTTCSVVDNTGTKTGSAVSASSSEGTGMVAVSDSGNFLYPGIEAESGNVTGSDVAASFGFRSFPDYGALAYGGLNGLYGATEDDGTGDIGSGVFGDDQGAEANKPDYNAGVLGESAIGTGVLGEANGSPAAGLYGVLPIGLYAVADSSASQGAFGLVAETDTATSLRATSSTGDTTVNLIDSNGNLIEADNFTSVTGYFRVDQSGDGDFSGTVTTSQNTLARTRGTSGASHDLYVEREAAPQIEDTGDARMTNGRAAVALDPALADSIDMRRPYEVFVTPYGESNALYVTQKTRAGFVVLEADGGRSTLEFNYRIVAKPFAENGGRLAAAPPPPAPERTLFRHRGAPVAAPLSPEQRLQRRLGMQGYAEALLVKRSRGPVGGPGLRVRQSVSNSG